jgi:hypothetical protein
MLKYFTAAIAAFILVTPTLVGAQDVPTYAQPQAQSEQQIRGRITAFDGAYSVSVRDEQGYIDNVQLHEGTIINPTGLTLAPGMTVSILGYNSGSYFSANEVDTPYTYYGGVPYYLGHPWFYYGPSISLGFFFGNRGWWHGGAFVGAHSFVGGVRVYNNVRIGSVYRNAGTFRGRDVVAPRERGGYHAGHAASHGHR